MIGHTTPWSIPLWRDHVDEILNPPTPNPPPLQEDDMDWRVAKTPNDGPWFIGNGKEALLVSDNGGDINVKESEFRMAKGAINARAIIIEDSTMKTIVTSWDNVGVISKTNVRDYVGENSRL
jgi:hypothetical protein